MFCPNCGAQVREGARFCSNCGHAMATEEANGSSDAPVPPAGFSGGEEGAAAGAANASQQPPQPEPPHYAAPANVVHAKSRVTAGLLAIFLGWLGLHKFYLGYTAPGLIMLIGFCILCFFGLGPIMAVIGFIEGLIYLTKSDQEFYRIYVAHQKEWF